MISVLELSFQQSEHHTRVSVRENQEGSTTHAWAPQDRELDESARLVLCQDKRIYDRAKIQELGHAIFEATTIGM